MPNIRKFTVLPALPKPLKPLEQLAKNLFWSWNPDVVALFQRIDPTLWTSSGHNPVKLLGNVPQERFDELSTDRGFLHELERVSEKLDEYMQQPSWFEQQAGGEKPLIAYFSAEYGLHESLPIYAGGLGILAGDHLKSASDLGIPLVGIGLLYQRGYFRQYLNVDGWQQEAYVDNDFYSLPLELVRQESGVPLTVSIEYPGRTVSAQIWEAKVGRVRLFLLDANIDANLSADRLITSGLYGGDREMRIRQEIMLGIGGYKALLAMDLKPTVCHMNEGHAGFMALERIRCMLNEENLSFDEAMEATRSGNIFTVHTPVKAGLDEFTVNLMDKYFGSYFPKLGLTREQFLSLGRMLKDDENESFKMPILALKLSSYRNGVSKLHGDVSRRMWSGLWPSVPLAEVPIDHVTNGVHVDSWLSSEIADLYERYLGPGWDQENYKTVADNIDSVPDEELWRAHQQCKGKLITFARDRLKAQMKRRGTFHSELNWAEEVLDPNALTIGFARRFATYKRGSLILRDPERFIKILTNPERPVQFLFAGKAHPLDSQGKEIIRQIVQFAGEHNVSRRLIFLEDYDIHVARHLVSGVDVWLNNPRPPKEASGTSGMKAAINGALNLSTLDGWWVEGYRPNAGWVVGAGETYDDEHFQDMVEAQAIYNLLEHEVVPLFFTRASDNLPRAWIKRMKNTMQICTPNFSTQRMLRDYSNKFYIPTAENWNTFTAEQMQRARDFSKWKTEMMNRWAGLSIKDVHVDIRNGEYSGPLNPRKPQMKVGANLDVSACVKLPGIKPEDVCVEMYHGSLDAWGEIKEGRTFPMQFKEANNGSSDEYWFQGTLQCANSGRKGLAVRVLPKHQDLTNTLDMGLILWESPKEDAAW